MAKEKWVIVEGFIHPEQGGDDQYFKRGFMLPKDIGIDEFKRWFIRNKLKHSAIKDDFRVKEVSQEEWEKLYHLPYNKKI